MNELNLMSKLASERISSLPRGCHHVHVQLIMMQQQQQQQLYSTPVESTAAELT